MKPSRQQFLARVCCPRLASCALLGALCGAGPAHAEVPVQFQANGIALSSNSPVVVAELEAARMASADPTAIVEERAARTEYARVMRRPGGFRGTDRSAGYVELASGLRYTDETGEWRDSAVEPEILADGSVRFSKLPVVHTFAPGSAQRLVLQSQRRGGAVAKSAPGGLSYYDLTTGKSALIAWVSNVPVRLHAEGVFYEHAFIGVDADIVYKVHRWGLEQDVVVYGGLPDPASFGMDPAQTRLCALTELVDFDLGEAGVTRDGKAQPAEPAEAPLEISVSRTGGWERVYNWQPSYAYPEEGTLALGGARGDGDRHPVAMRVFQAAGRVFLSEEVPLHRVRAVLPDLIAGVSRTDAARTVKITAAQPIAIPPERTGGMIASGHEPHVPQASYTPRASSRYVLDYVNLSGTVTDDITLGQGQTYYISGQLTLSGSKLTVEPGAFVKFAPSAKIYLQSSARVECRSHALNPALFTYVGDTNSAGEQIGTNAHINGRFTCALDIASGTNLLQGLSIRHAALGVKVDSSGQQTLRDVQFSRITRAVECWGGAATTSLENVLIETATQGVLVASAKADLRAVTFSGVTNWALCTSGSVSTLTVKDSLFAAIGGTAFASNTALASAAISGNGQYLATNGWLGTGVVALGASPFAGGTYGSFYLIQTTALINAGTTNASAVGLYHFTTATSGTKETNSIVDIGFHYPSTEDYDSDGLLDFLEDRDGDGTYTTNDIADWTDADTDNDTLSDGSEYLTYGTDPKSTDNDGDGQDDAQEVNNGSDPLNANSYLTGIAGTLVYGGGQTGVFRVVATAEPDLLVHYSFDSNSASTVTDLSGFGYTATNYNGVQWVSNGYLNGAYHFDGTNDWIGGVNLGLLPTGSVSMWVKADAVDQWRHPFATEYASWDDNLHFNMGPPAWFEASGLGISSSITMASNFVSNVWFHAVMTWTRTNFQAYFNGTWTGKRGHSGVYPPGMNLKVPTLTIGNSYSTAATRYWRGYLDEFKLYKKELSAAEVSNLYAQGVASSIAHTASQSTAGSYVITNVPTLRKYSVAAWLDSDQDGTLDSTEASGSYSNNPFWVSGYTTNIDITLSDPDTDGDGLPDWWEILYGLNPTSPVPGQGEGWWKFDESSGTNAANSAGTGYTGGLVNMATNAWVAGQLGNALQFDGTNDYVRVPQSPAIITGQQFTASAWAWIDACAADLFPSIIADMTNCTYYGGFWLGVEDPYYWEASVGTCAGNIFPYTPVQTNAWVYLALTHDGTNTRMYVNGDLKSTTATSFTPARMSEVRIGWAEDPAPWYSYHWMGKLDDVRLYKTALVSNAVATMYQNLLDVDGDGYDYLEEYAAGTSPTESNAPPDIAITYPADGGILP